MNEHLLLSTKEAGKILGLSQDHVRRLLEDVKKGSKNSGIRGKKIGNSWVITELNYQRKRKPKHSKREQ